MSDVLTFRGSRMKAAVALVACVVFIIAGYYIRSERPLIAWAVIVFFGFGFSIILILLLSPKSTYLRLDAEGFEMGSYVKKTRTKWSDVERFELGAIRGAKMIRIVYSPSYKEQMMLRAVASRVSGMEGGIADSYDAPLIEILRRLNEWRERHGSNVAS